VASITYHRPAVVGRILHDRHTVIEANAGTGKTYVIEHLVADLILRTNCSIEELLVVTFTEKAAEELRSRIRSLLENIVSGVACAPGDNPDEVVEIDSEGREKLDKALFSFDAASICTIHAFCRRVLKDFAFDTGSLPGAQLVDASRALHRAFRAQLREVFALHDDSRGLLEEWLRAGKTAREPTLIDSLEELLRQCHFDRYLQSGSLENNCQAMIELVEAFDAEVLKKLCERKRRRLGIDAVHKIEELESILRHEGLPPEALQAALARFDFEGLPYRASHLTDPRERRLLAALDRARAASSLEVRIVDAFLPRIAERLRLDKRNFNEIDYSDMLECLWEALDGGRGSSLTEVLRGRFRYGLVDEFQDTDDIQWRIFRRIFLESTNGNTLFVVGDPKQAIYSFRGADVFTYLEAKQEIITVGGALVELSENYRSTKSLLQATDTILDAQAKPPLFSGENGYNLSATCGRKDLQAHDLNGNALLPVTLLKYRPNKGPGAASRLRASVGRHIASLLRAILFDPEAAITVTNSDETRPVKAQDIFILTRTGAEAVEIGGYLREQGVPFAFYKKEGLFQTAEAYDVLDVLNAIAEPDSESKKLRAWITPFFAIPYPELFDRSEIPSSHPANERLREWNLMAEREQFGALFDHLMHRSGLAARELFLANSERELTNYWHIFEILLEQASAEQLSLKEVIVRLESFVAGTALPANLESNIQRLESDRSAVQIMTVHMSKGLEADVVFLFGGTAISSAPPRVSVYHDDKSRRRIAVGSEGQYAAKRQLMREVRAESERLAYVGLTRARAKLYLPVYPEGSTKRPLNGYYEALNNRLRSLSAEIDDSKSRVELFEQVEVRDTRFDEQAISLVLSKRVADWVPPEALIGALKNEKSERHLERLRIRSRPMVTRSYTSLESGVARGVEADIDTQEFKSDVEAVIEDTDLKGGRRVGVFLHEAIEKLDFGSLSKAGNLTSWRQDEGVGRVFADAMRHNQVTDPRWFDRGTEIVFTALTSPISVPTGRVLGPLYMRDGIREMEFVFPIPEHSHALLQSGSDHHWIARRGYLKGFVDLVFQHDGLHYFADWKSDFLRSYHPHALIAHVREHYALQAQIYSIGVVRLLEIRNEAEYNDRFGGLLYLFLRGMKSNSAVDGVYFHRPDWTEVCRYEEDLIRAA